MLYTVPFPKRSFLSNICLLAILINKKICQIYFDMLLHKLKSSLKQLLIFLSKIPVTYISLQILDIYMQFNTSSIYESFIS